LSFDGGASCVPCPETTDDNDREREIAQIKIRINKNKQQQIYILPVLSSNKTIPIPI
jgi:hypothetical protein